jgi:hypothetical protein
MRCDWTPAQKAAFTKKINRYKQAIKNKQNKDGRGGIRVSPCEREPKTAAEIWEEDCDRNPPEQKSPKGKGVPADCTKDIDHIIDVQMGGAQDPPEVCENLTPVNTSVNRSIGAQFKDQIKEATRGKKFAVLTDIVVEEPECPDKTPRTPACV